MRRHVIRLERPSKHAVRAARKANPGAVIEAVGRSPTRPKKSPPAPAPEIQPLPTTPRRDMKHHNYEDCGRCGCLRPASSLVPVTRVDGQKITVTRVCREEEWCNEAIASKAERAARQGDVIEGGSR